MVLNVFLCFLVWINNLLDYEDEGYSDVDEEEFDEEFNQKIEGIMYIYRCCLFGCFIVDFYCVVFIVGCQ